MTGPSRPGTAWKKSSRSNGQANCVEVARFDDGVAARDSKNPTGPVLRLPSGAWGALMRSV